MRVVTTQTDSPAAIRTDLGAIFVSLELSRSKWLVTSLAPDSGGKLSRHEVAPQIGALLPVLAQVRAKTKARTGMDFPIITIHEAGLDGFWIDRVLRSDARTRSAGVSLGAGLRSIWRF